MSLNTVWKALKVSERTSEWVNKRRGCLPFGECRLEQVAPEAGGIRCVLSFALTYPISLCLDVTAISLDFFTKKIPCLSPPLEICQNVWDKVAVHWRSKLNSHLIAMIKRLIGKWKSVSRIRFWIFIIFLLLQDIYIWKFWIRKD